jgi:uncharacterized RmlC-like cupin family protein
LFWEGLVWRGFGMLRKLCVGCDRKTSQAMHGERQTAVYCVCGELRICRS